MTMVKQLSEIYQYFQKSHVFLYPLLGIRKGVSVTPIKTYISWEGHVRPEDRKLVCLYHLRNDKEYTNFEQSVLFKNKYFDDFKEVGDGKAVYVFDLSKHAADFDAFVRGHYSKFSPKTKAEIKGYHGYFRDYAYLESYLYPERFFSMYARILYDKADLKKGEALLRKVGELCEKPDLEKETLRASVLELQIT